MISLPIQRVEEAMAQSIFVNGEPTDVAAVRLDAALAELGFAAATVATALNGDFVPAAKRALTKLSAGDRLEVVSARQGG
jgi:sulfur carrier protein